MKKTYLCAAVVVLLIAALAGCQASEDTSDAATKQVADEEAEPIEWTPEEEHAFLECSSGKLGYTLTEERLNTFEENIDGIINTEAEWEDQRVARAYTQCQLELHPDRFDEASDTYKMAHMFAYALDPDGKRVHDPLEPWPGKDGLP